MACYDTNHFMAPECEIKYYKDLIRKKLLHERRISLEKVDENLPNLYKRLEGT